MSDSTSTERPIRILTLGMGALGSIYSFVLSQSSTPKCHITCVARSNYSTLSDPNVGITIRSDKFGVVENWIPDRVLQDGNEAHHAQSREDTYDFVLCCFKVVDEGVKSTSDVLRPWLREGGEKKTLPTIVMIQNGIGIELEPQRMLVDCERPRARGISSGVAWIGANLKENGTVVTQGSMERIEMGFYSGDQRHQELFRQAYESGGGCLDIKEDIQPIRWGKLLWNAAWASMCSLSRQSLSALLEPAVLPYIVGPVRRTMLEVMDVARAHGITEERLPIEAVDKAFNITYVSRPRREDDTHRDGDPVSTVTDGFKPSLLLDLEAGRPMEVKGIVGNVVELARRHGVETPRLDMALAALRASQVEALRKTDNLTQQEADARSHGDRLPAGVPVGLMW